MTDFHRHPSWPSAQTEGKRQRGLGILSAITLAFALVTLVDGLQASMRAGNNELEFIPGQSMALSGPVALKNPLASDVQARFEPENAPFTFTLDGFFTGYWFGSGMWRGQLLCDPDASAGSCRLVISFRGSGAQNAQRYHLRVYADQTARWQASRSLTQRLFHVSPFMVSALFGGAGILAGMATYCFGWKLARSLRRQGLAEIYARQGDTILCLSPKAIAPGTPCAVFDAKGAFVGDAIVDGWIKGKIRLVWPGDRPLPPHALVRLRHPEKA